MPGAVARAWRILLALVVFATASWALGQAPAPPSPGQPMPPPKTLAPENSRELSVAQQRLEEIKVELALLGDIDSFPYPVGASFRGGQLELFGFVPDDLIRQNVVDIARRSTSLKLNNSVAIRNDVSVPSAARPAQVLQKEGVELLRSHLRDRAKQMTLQVRPDSVVVLTGPVDSMERKLQISRLFRELPGCAGVDNQLTLETINRAGQQMVQVTRDGSLFVPPSALSLQPGTLAAAPPTPNKIKQVSFTDKQPAAAPQPGSAAPVRAVSLTAKSPAPAPAIQQQLVRPVKPNPPPRRAENPKEPELRLPPVVAPAQLSKQAKPMPDKILGESDPANRAKLPVKWGHPSDNWEAQLKQLEPAHDRRAALPQPPPASSRLPISLPPIETKKTANIATETRIQPPTIQPPPRSAAAQPVRPPQMIWKRPGGEEHSEPKIAIATSEPTAAPKPSAVPQTPPSLPPLRSARRWPPAYVTGPPPSQGRRGTILFADNPPPPPPLPPQTPAPSATSRRITPAGLQQKVKSVCGKQASEVAISVHIDGSLLVRVKVPNRSIEDQLSRKILALPDMSSPNVRLLMEVEP